MSAYEYLKNLDNQADDNQFSNTQDNQVEQTESSFLPAAIVAGFFGVLVLFLYWYRRKLTPSLITFRFVVNIQNYFQNPVIRNVHFYQGDHIVPTGND